MDEFGNILNNATQQANDTYASNTASADAAQKQANTQLANVNSEGQLANQNAAKLSGLGDQYSNMGNVTDMYNKDQQSQLDNMGFDKTTLNQANQNIAQQTGALGAAQNQMAAEGGSRGFNAVGADNRQAGIQAQAGNAINANAAVQSNELGQANTAATYTGQEIGAQQNSQGNAISAYNDAASQQNNTMANYAQTLSTMAQQATTYGGLVGSNVANLMAAANSASQAALAKYQAQVDVSQVNLNNASAENQSAQAGLANANTALTRQQVAYNAQMQPLQLQAEKMVTDNIDLQKAQMNHLSDEINGYNKQLDKYNSSSGLALLGGNVLRSMFDWTGLKGKIANDQSQITSLGGNVSTEGASLGTFK